MKEQEFYTTQEQREFVSALLEKAQINLTVDEFLKIYSENRGCKMKNVARNIIKWQLHLPGNFKYLRRILQDSLNFLTDNPKG